MLLNLLCLNDSIVEQGISKYMLMLYGLIQKRKVTLSKRIHQLLLFLYFNLGTSAAKWDRPYVHMLTYAPEWGKL